MSAGSKESGITGYTIEVDLETAVVLYAIMGNYVFGPGKRRNTSELYIAFRESGFEENHYALLRYVRSRMIAQPHGIVIERLDLE